MDAGDATPEMTTGYEYLEHMVRALSADSSQLHLKLFLQKDIVLQQRGTIDALRNEVEELKETVKALQDEKELFEFQYLEERCKREHIEEETGCTDAQQDRLESLKTENAELNHKVHAQLQLEFELRNTIQELLESMKELQENASSAMAGKESLQHLCEQQMEKMAAYDQKFDLMEGRYEFITEKLAAEKSALQKTVTRIQTEKDTVAAELKKKLADCVSLQEELARLKACPNAKGDPRKTFEDKCTSPDRMDAEKDEPSGIQENEEVSMKEARDEQQEGWIQLFKILPIDLQGRILPLVLRELGKTVRARKQVLLLLKNQAMGMTDDSKWTTMGKAPSEVAETLSL